MKAYRGMIAFILALTMFMSGSSLTAFAAQETEAVEETEPLLQTEEAAEMTIPEETLPEAEPDMEASDPTEAVDDFAEETVPEDIPLGTDFESDLPAFYQEDYPDIPCGEGTIASHGSAVTALAMVASYLTGYPYTPDQLGNFFHTGTDDEIMVKAVEALGLNGYRTENVQEAFDALEKGCVAICAMNNQSVFTSSRHWIVLERMTGEGQVVVRDPLRANLEKDMLREGYEKGFPQGWISTGWEEAWIFNPEDLPETVALYTGPQPTQHEMPLYDQKDYPNVRYGSGTVATSGCGITALAMVATYMTGHTYYPDELADAFGGYNGNNVERLLYASDQLQLPWYYAENWHVVLEELKAGNVAIFLVDGRSDFTDKQHFMVASGVTEEGRVTLLDPYGPNYDNPMLKKGFEQGFTTSEIVPGYSGAWVYEVDKMPEKPFIYIEEEKPYVEPRYGSLSLTSGEMELLARMVWVEARGEPDEGQQAVAEVVLNRVVSEDFQDTVQGVIYAENQFRSTKFLKDAEPTQTQYEAVENALYGPYILPMDVTHFATYAVNDYVWGKIGGHIFCHQWSPESE